MEEQNLSQRGLAARAGLGISTLRKVLNQESDPALSTLLGLAGALGLHSLEELLGPIGTMEVLMSGGHEVMPRQGPSATIAPGFSERDPAEAS
jgi:transcriptional regulator with XRE-family HTH domain